MKNLILQYKVLIYPLIVGLASAVLIVFVIVPQLRGFLSGQDDLKQKQARLNNLEVKAKELEGLDQKIYTEKLLAALYYLPVDKDFSNIIGIFRELTAAAGMSLTSLHPSVNSVASGSYSVKADVVGPVNNLGNLLDVIEKSPRVMKLQSIDTTPSTSGILNVTLSVSVYFSPTPVSLGAVDALLPQITQQDQIILNSLSLPSEAPGQVITLPSGKANPFE